MEREEPFDARQLEGAEPREPALERLAGASDYGAGSGVVFENVRRAT